MAERDVELRVTARDDTGSGMDSVARRAKRTGDEVERTFKSSGDRAGKGFAGSLASGVSGLGRFAAGLGLSVGENVAKSAAGGIQSAGPQINAALTLAVAGAVTTAAPLLSAGLSGAVVGGAAGAGIVGGLLLAARDSRVRTAAAGLGETVMGDLTRRAGGFVAPLLSGIEAVEARWAKLGPLVSRGLAIAATYVQPLTNALINATESGVQGLVSAIAGAGPVVSAVAYGIERFGESARDALVIFGSLGEEGGQALRDIIDIIAGATDFVVHFVAQLTWLYGQVRTLGGLLGDDGAGVDQLGDDMANTSVDTSLLSIRLSQLGADARSAADATTYLGKAQRDLGNAAVTLDEAEARYHETLNTTATIRERGTQITAAETLALIGLRREAEAQIEAYRATGATAEEVSVRTQKLRNDFVNQAIQMGYTRQAAENLANQYGLIPFEIKTPVSAPGIGPAIQNARELERAINSIDRVVDIAIRVTNTSASRSAVAAALNKQNFAAEAGQQQFAQMTTFAESSYASTRGAGGARPATPRVQLTNALTVMLDGRALAPEMYAVADTAVRERSWRGRVGERW